MKRRFYFGKILMRRVFEVWPSLRAIRINFVVCCPWRRFMMAAHRANRLGSAVPGRRQLAIGDFASTGTARKPPGRVPKLNGAQRQVLVEVVKHDPTPALQSKCAVFCC